ncbi:MAG: hypothetical protein J5855_10485 [Mailhella sp.]|nr:hypothetical protein [Mailhella sp.]
MKKLLSVAEAVRRAAYVFEMNVSEKEVLALGASAGLCGGDTCGLVLDDLQEKRAGFLYEWRGFAHAAVFNALMEHSPGVTVLEYLRGTVDMMKSLGYSEATALGFVDTAFKAYSDAFINRDAAQCPAIFFDRFLGIPLEKVDKHSAAVLSGTMAMLTAACLDVFEKYDYLTE